MTDGLELTPGEQFATLSIHRPGRRNAMNRRMWQALPELLDSGARQWPVLIITGAGGDFCAGADVQEFGAMTVAEANAAFADMQIAIEALADLPVPTIAAIEGFALGAGLLLALACDIRVSGRGMRVGMPVARFGITVTTGFIRPLVRVVGPDRARALLMTGRLCRTLEAYQLGIIHRLVAAGEAFPTARAMAAQISGYSPGSLRASRRAVWGEEETAGQYVDPADFPVRVAAFLASSSAQRK